MTNPVMIAKGSLSTLEKTTISIDGKSIDLIPGETNIVDIAARAKIGIPAPCYLEERKQGCCSGCVVEIDGEQAFACSAAPKHGMEIVVNRPDLKALRKERILAYAKDKKNGISTPCSTSGESSCGTSSSTSSSCCG